MELNHSTGKLRVNYGDRLVTLMREVRQLGAMGFVIPAKIQHVANTAQKFYRHGVVLKQVIFHLLLQMIFLNLVLIKDNLTTINGKIT